MKRLLAATLLLLPLVATADDGDDPYLWLEDVEGERALDWVRGQNDSTFAELRENELFQSLYREAFSILTADERIPEGQIIGDDFHSFWQDESAVRGHWRRTDIESFKTGQPDWEIVLSVDELADSEHENWVWQGVNCLGGDSDRCLVELSRGGKDESVYREFSLTDKAFVDDGFVVPEAKSNVAWLDEDRLLVATNWGDGSLTNSGYAREARLWTRGEPIEESTSLFVAETEDTLLAPFVIRNGDSTYAFLVRLFADWNETEYRPVVDGKAMPPLDIPLRTAFAGIIDGDVILGLEEVWEHSGERYTTGDIVTFDLESGETGLVFSPNDKQAVRDVEVGQGSLYLGLLDNVIGRIWRLTRDEDGWQRKELALPDNGVATIVASSSSREDLFVSFENAVQPTTLYHVSGDNELSTVMSLPAQYDATGVVIRQQFATSADGQSVPYFIVGREDVLEEGDAPAILYGYGGFQIPILPVYYSDPSRPQHGALAGRMWLSRGGVLAIANLRGGGEFGPRWHQSALRENRQRAYDDYFAIAEDMIDAGVTSPDKLGALGRSNGGLLLGVALTQRPDLFAALDIGVPLLDMKRYSKLLAGSSWMGEYGNPDVPEDWAFIREYSPYQNLEDGKDYPKVLFYTSTQDDRVHPGHARKMAAWLEDKGYDFFYYENMEGGHGGTANQDQLAMRTALEYAYFIRMLMPAVWDREAIEAP